MKARITRNRNGLYNFPGILDIDKNVPDEYAEVLPSPKIHKMCGYTFNIL